MALKIKRTIAATGLCSQTQLDTDCAFCIWGRGKGKGRDRCTCPMGTVVQEVISSGATNGRRGGGDSQPQMKPRLGPLLICLPSWAGQAAALAADAQTAHTGNDQTEPVSSQGWLKHSFGEKNTSKQRRPTATTLLSNVYSLPLDTVNIFQQKHFNLKYHSQKYPFTKIPLSLHIYNYLNQVPSKKWMLGVLKILPQNVFAAF